MEPTIDVLLCTFRRPSLADAIASLAAQELPPGVTMGVIVADNDDAPSAEGLLREAAKGFPHPLAYLHAPARNISVARNACLDRALAPWVAFLDDDETAPPGWIAALWRAAQASGADAVFGPALAAYPTDAPAWISSRDYHSNRPERRGGLVATGHTCNALLRWGGTPWEGLRFDLARGTSGGEDTAFFFAAARLGARYAEAPEAVVHEPVEPSRLTFGWLARRRFRMGQSYASSESGAAGRARLGAMAVGKALACGGAAALMLPSKERRNFWLLRGALHAGVVAGCLSLPEPRAYGG